MMEVDFVEKVELTVSMEPERLDALRYFLSAKEKSTPEKELQCALDQLYEKYVPAEMREYLDSKSAPASRARRPSKPKPAPTTSIPATVPREDGVTHE